MKPLSESNLVVLEKKFQIESSSVDVLYNSSYTWLLKNGATILEHGAFTLIAEHELLILLKNPENADAVLGNWDPVYWKKKIVIEIISEKGKIELIIKFLTYDAANMDLKKRWWSELLEDYINYMDLTPDSVWLNEIHSNDHKKQKIFDLLYTSLPQLFFFFIGIFASVILVDITWVFILIIAFSLNQIRPIISRMIDVYRR